MTFEEQLKNKVWYRASPTNHMVRYKPIIAAEAYVWLDDALDAVRQAREEERKKIKEEDLKLTKEYFSAMDSQDPVHNTNSWEKELASARLNEKQKTLEGVRVILKERLYKFKGRKVIDEIEIDESIQEFLSGKEVKPK